MDLISLLITVVILGVVFWLVKMALDAMPMEPPFKAVANAVLILIMVLVLLGLLFGQVSLPSLRLR